jgi:uncharacterized protein (TIGR01777 family)
MQTIGITGGTGFVGSHICKLLTDQGHHVVIFTRSGSKKSASLMVSYAHWDPAAKTCDTGALGRLDAIVHLAGANLAGARWTEKRKKEIVESRVAATAFLVEQLKTHAPNCKTMVSASATGFYGPDRPGVIPFTEEAPAYPDFLGELCKEWEAAAQPAAGFLRLVIVRFGIVLGKESGAFAAFVKPVSFGIMPVLGSGNQMVSWIHVDDLAQLVITSLHNEKMQGIYNGVAPEPVAHKTLMKTIAHAKGGIKIPAPVPAFVLKLMLGEMSVEVLKSATVSAQKVLNTGFSYRFPTIGTAVEDLV